MAAGTKKTTKRVDPSKDIYNSRKVGATSETYGGDPAASAKTGGLFDIIKSSTDKAGGVVNAASTTGGGTDNTGTGQTYTPFGNAFTPGMYGEIWSNPDTLVREKLRKQGIGTRGGTYASLLDQANNLGILWMLQQGKQAAEGTPGFIDWSGNYLDQMLTPGGKSVSAADIANDLLGAAGDANNPNYEYLANSGLTPSDQVGNVLSTLNSSLKGANMPDIVRSAYLARARELGDTFQNQRVRGIDDGHSFLNDLIQSGYLGALGGSR